MRELILEYLQRPQYRPRKLKELARDMGISTAEYRAFRQVMRELEDAGEVARVGRTQFVRAGASRRALGSLHLDPRGFGFVARTGPEPDVLIQARHLGGAADGDWVEVEILSSGGRGRLPEGRVTAIRQRPTARLVGVLVRQGRHAAVRPDEKRWGSRVELTEPPPPEAAEGAKVAVLVTALTPAGQAEAGRVTEVLGSPEDPATDLRVVVAKHGLRVEFPEAALREADGCAEVVDAAVQGRRDLRGVATLTIDPAEARDFDDAVSLDFDAAGHCCLGVHIADVGHYVGPGTALDLEARERGTSVYLVDGVLPMLPERLSGELCTLAPGQDRLTLSVLVTIDGAGRVLAAEICESAIRSRARLTYPQVQAAIDGEGDAGPAGDWVDLLTAMRALSRRLKARRLDRGALDFDLPEPRVDLDAEGRPVRLGRRPRLKSHQLIEEFMLAANEAVAAFAEERSLAVLYRTHRPPDAAKLATFAAYASTMGHRLKNGDAAPTAARLQEILAAFAGRPDADLVSQLLLRAMMRAEYSPELEGHYGLAAPRYLHFTSPIRRYPDLQVHRQIKAALRTATALPSAVAPDRVPPPDPAPPAPGAGSTGWPDADLQWLGAWTTDCERRAAAAERDHVRSKQLRYMLQHVGDEFGGRVTGLLPGGIFAEVGELMVEGFCPLSALSDYYELDEQRHCLVGQSGDRYRIGTAVRLRIARVDLAQQRLDLLILSRGEPGGRRAGRRDRRPGRSRHRRRR